MGASEHVYACAQRATSRWPTSCLLDRLQVLPSFSSRTGKPPAGLGIDTAAAFANPLCDKTQGPCGKLDFVFEGGYPDRGGGPICIALWKGRNNGGKTYQGVTKDSIRVVALVPNDQQIAAPPPQGRPTKNNVGTPGSGTMEGVLRDAIEGPYQRFFETYGRKVDLEFITSSGDDESAQRRTRSRSRPRNRSRSSTQRGPPTTCSSARSRHRRFPCTATAAPSPMNQRRSRRRIVGVRPTPWPPR
jgi:hypothetical protein